MFGDRADRPMVAPISSATEASRELKIERMAGLEANIYLFLSSSTTAATIAFGESAPGLKVMTDWPERGR